LSYLVVTLKDSICNHQAISLHWLGAAHCYRWRSVGCRSQNPLNWSWCHSGYWLPLTKETMC